MGLARETKNLFCKYGLYKLCSFRIGCVTTTFVWPVHVYVFTAASNHRSHSLIQPWYFG